MSAAKPKQRNHANDGSDPIPSTPHARAPGESVNGDVGTRLRRVRRARGLTLKQVADEVGLSHNFLSMIERGDTDVSLARFLRLAHYYGLRPSELLVDDDAYPMISTPVDATMIDRGPGIKFSLLPNQEFGVQVFHVTFQPHARYRDFKTHAGGDIAWVIRGTLTVYFGEEEFTVTEGGCVSFESRTPHSFGNSTGKVTEIFGVATAPVW